MKKILIIIATLVLSLASFNLPVFATRGSESFVAVEANVLKTCAGSSDGVKCILLLVVDILSIGVGILGVIGISVVGVQYLTAGGSEEKTRKAKRRMLEIIIGLVLYAVSYALIKFLLPS